MSIADLSNPQSHHGLQLSLLPLGLVLKKEIGLGLIYEVVYDPKAREKLHSNGASRKKGLTISPG